MNVLNFFILITWKLDQQVMSTQIWSHFIYWAEKVHIVIVLFGVLGTGNRDLWGQRQLYVEGGRLGSYPRYDRRCGHLYLLKRTNVNYTWGWQTKFIYLSLNIFDSSSRRFSPGSNNDQCRKAEGFWLQCSYRPSSRHDPGCCLQGALARGLVAWNFLRVLPEYDLSTFAKI